MSAFTESQLRELHELPMDDLYSRFFTDSDEGKGFLGSPGMKRAKGKKLFEKYRDRIKQAVCEDWDGCKKVHDFEDMVALIGAIATLIAVQLPHLSTAAAAAIVVKHGIRSFCDCP